MGASTRTPSPRRSRRRRRRSVDGLPPRGGARSTPPPISAAASAHWSARRCSRRTVVFFSVSRCACCASEHPRHAPASTTRFLVLHRRLEPPAQRRHRLLQRDQLLILRRRSSPRGLVLGALHLGAPRGVAGVELRQQRLARLLDTCTFAQTAGSRERGGGDETRGERPARPAALGSARSARSGGDGRTGGLRPRARLVHGHAAGASTPPRTALGRRRIAVPADQLLREERRFGSCHARRRSSDRSLKKSAASSVSKRWLSVISSTSAGLAELEEHLLLQPVLLLRGFLRSETCVAWTRSSDSSSRCFSVSCGRASP